MIRITDYADDKLILTLSNYVGLNRTYGAPPIFYWYCNVINAIQGLDKDTSISFGSQTLPMEKSLGIVYFTCVLANKEKTIVVEDFDINMATLLRFVSCRGIHSTSTIKTRSINSINYVRPFRSFRLANGNLVYAVQSDTHLYSLADKGKNLVIDKWFDSLSFPIQQQIENLQIIGYGSCKGIPYYIDSNLKIHHGAEIAQMRRRKIEGIERHKIRLTEEEFYQLITECVLQTLKEIC